eukprot:TRINITY_DN6087_c0_g1_i1.p1 TRINITY_DN6087_c0_g1~~TRINITY_DN6087_c0_g1_i1.p1  ORF type:complete len:431 (+),score=59.32 TRINITY_DN6087_c0_g1_i1:138-1430(+)
MQPGEDDESLTSVSNFTPEITPKHAARKVTLVNPEDKPSPLMEKAMRVVDVGCENSEMKRNWERRRSSVGAGIGSRSAPQLLEFMEGARRRASRVTLADDTEFCPESPRGNASPTNRSATPSENSPTHQQEYVNTLRDELERCRFDILQMADVGSALLVELEDTKTVLLEVENERDRHEKKVDVLTETSNGQKKQINELKVMVSIMREEMEDLKRRHELELREVEKRTEHAGGVPQGEDEHMYQGVALQQLRRARLVAERVEAAQALFKVGSAEPQIVEIEHRKTIEEQMWRDRCELLWNRIEDAQQNWKAACNSIEQVESSNDSLRSQMLKVIEARLRAESMASQQAELHEDARKVIAQKTTTIQRLQAELSATRVHSHVAEDLGPAVQSALRRVHELKMKCFGDFAASPLRVTSPPRDPVSPSATPTS